MSKKNIQKIIKDLEIEADGVEESSPAGCSFSSTEIRDEIKRLQILSDRGNILKECQTCGFIKEENPTPDGDEICPDCGDREMLDLENY